MSEYNNDLDDWAWGNFQQLLEDRKTKDLEDQARKKEREDKKQWFRAHYKAGDGKWYKL